jgi:hypothetical protein
MSCRLVQIFEAQAELMQRFLLIEADGGFAIPSRIPINPHDPHDQVRAKELAWRVTEEIGEARSILVEKGDHTNEFREEMSDALHFLVELYIVVGVETSEWPCRSSDRLDELFMMAERDMFNLEQTKRRPPTVEEQLALVVWDLADAMHELKNRPWKRSRVATNTIAYRNKLRNAMDSFILACFLSGITPVTLHTLYFRKHEINRQRQDSGV